MGVSHRCSDWQSRNGVASRRLSASGPLLENYGTVGMGHDTIVPAREAEEAICRHIVETEQNFDLLPRQRKPFAIR